VPHPLDDRGREGSRIKRSGPQRDINSLRKQVPPMIHERQIDVQGWMVVPEAGNPILIKLGVWRIPARRTAAFCSRKPTVPASRLLIIRTILSL
jgi:hypothetical protein